MARVEENGGADASQLSKPIPPASLNGFVAAPRKRELSTLQMRPPNRNLSPLFLYSANVYDLEMDFCGEGHGFLLQAGEDARVLELMKKEETDRERKVLAEDKWASTVRHLCSGSFIDKVRGFFR